MKRLALLAFAVTAFAAPASAQPLTPGGDPNYETVELNSGFTPDPHVISLQAGGTVNAQRTGRGCTGFVTLTPDVRLNYRAGSLPLIVSVASDADTTLVINGPNGQWYCDDDGGVNGANPSVRFNNPTSGQYDIYVGTYASGATSPARLHISEISSQ